MKLRLNLSTTPHENKRPFLAGAACAGVVGIVALGLLSHAAYRSWQANRELRADMSHWESIIRSDERQQTELQNYFHTPSAQQMLDRAGFLNSLINQRSFPWTKMFADLEQTLPPGVRVVNIAPKLKDGRVQVQLTIAAMNDEGKVKFIESMEKSKAFSDIQVSDDKYLERTSQTGPNPDRVVLTLTATYVTT
jgi:Tfp pilus assembly protein PilN